MFLYTDYRPEEIEVLRRRDNTSPGRTYSDYKMEVPLQVEFISMRPGDPLEYFTMASVIPEHIYHVALTKEEIGNRFETNSLHRHSYYELLFVLSGALYYNIEHHRHLYTPGSCCLLNHNVLHVEERTTDFDVLFLGISDEVLRDVYRDLTEGFFTVEKERPASDLDRFLRENLLSEGSYDKQYVDFIPREAGAPRSFDTAGAAGPDGKPLTDAPRPDDVRYSRNPSVALVRDIFTTIQDELLTPRIGSTHRIKALIAKLLHTLSDSAWYETSPIQIGTDAENRLYDEIDQILRQTQGRASRSFLEEELHYSGDYLNKITKKYTGLSIHDYGMTICMGLAADRLLACDLSVGEIAASLGFSNRTHFYKQFDRVYHMSPAQYRRTYREESDRS